MSRLLQITALALTLSLTVATCGQKGPLELPEPDDAQMHSSHLLTQTDWS